MSNDSEKLIIAYDGDCPLCASYVRMQRLNDLNMKLELINFREAPELIEKLKQQGLNPNNGMYVELAGTSYYADEAMTVLSSLSTSKNWLNLAFKWWFKSKARAKFLYPVLRGGRGIVLKIMGRAQL
jgi:predicted DCC family thiol-disulfide oxidoreductase YuxK